MGSEMCIRDRGYVEDIIGIPLRGGKAKGEIIVSNLTIATFLIGTNHFPDCKGKIIIFEDINEDIYKIDRMLTYLRMTKTISEMRVLDSEVFLMIPATLN